MSVKQLLVSIKRSKTLLPAVADSFTRDYLSSVVYGFTILYLYQIYIIGSRQLVKSDYIWLSVVVFRYEIFVMRMDGAKMRVTKNFI